MNKIDKKIQYFSLLTPFDCTFRDRFIFTSVAIALNIIEIFLFVFSVGKLFPIIIKRKIDFAQKNKNYKLPISFCFSNTSNGFNTSSSLNCINDILKAPQHIILTKFEFKLIFSFADVTKY